MARLSRREERERLMITVLAAIAVGLLLILGIRAIAASIASALQGTVPDAAIPQEASTASSFSAAPSSSSATPSTNAGSYPSRSPLADTTPAAAATSTLVIAPPSSFPEPPPPPIPPSNIVSADFTELFSGKGWSDTADTDTYEDYSAMAISLMPRFTVTPTTASFAPAPVIPSGAPADLTGNVRQDGAEYVATVDAYPGFAVTSTYPGILRFGYDPATGHVLVVYAAYESRVLEMGAPSASGTSPVIADYSMRFGPRAFGGGQDGVRAVQPVVFAQDGAWWIFSGDGSTEPKLMKIQNGAVIDYTQTAFPHEATLAAAPGPAPHEIYVKGSTGSYVFDDEGFASAPAQWVSAKLNLTDGAVVSGMVVSVHASPASTGTIAYYISDDGGITWMATVPGQQMDFPAPGTDFRYKIVLSPSATRDPYATPWVDLITVRYGIKQAG